MNSPSPSPAASPATSPEEIQRRKLAAAREALAYVQPGQLLGVGSGSTVNIFISLLAERASDIPAVVAASKASEAALTAAGLRVRGMDDVSQLGIYVDGADEIDPRFRMIKGGGAALTREKIIAQAAERFICIVDASKEVDRLGRFPLPIEIVPPARALVAATVERMGGVVRERAGVVTDNGNLILVVTGLDFGDPEALERNLNQIPGVVCNGVFALRPADVCITAGERVTIRSR